MALNKERAEKARRLYEKKLQAMEYYKENGVPQKMETILNSMFYDKPDDVFGHVANYFESYAKIPTVTKIRGRVALDSKCQSTAQADIYCIIKNFEKLIHSCCGVNENFPPETASPEEQAEAALEHKTNVDNAVNFINGPFAEVLQGLDPTKQQEIDALLLAKLEEIQKAETERLEKEKAEGGEMEQTTSSTPAMEKGSAKGGRKSAGKGKGGKGAPVAIVPDEPREKLLSGSSVVSVLSQCVCSAGAQLTGSALYRRIAQLKYGDEGTSCDLRMPLPMVTILTSGKMWPGKLNCVKEFMVVPQPGMPLQESITHIANIYHFCAKYLSAKAGLAARNTTDLGALCPQFDKVEQGLDLLQEAITSLGLTPGEHFSLALNLGCNECFDYDKGKYEVIGGSAKLADDLVEFYADLKTRYPAIIAIIDPMRKQDKEVWMKLCERVSESTYVMGDLVYHRPGLLKDEEIPADFRTNAIVLKLENVTTITDFIQTADKMREADNEIVVTSHAGDTADSFIVDLAVGIGAKFLKLGGPCRGERVAKLNRLLQIEAELIEDGKLAEGCEHTFTMVKPPTPPPEVEEGAEGAEGTAPAEEK